MPFRQNSEEPKKVSESHLEQSEDIWKWCSGCKQSYSHIHLAQVAMAVLNHVSVFGAVEGRDRTPAASRADVEVSWVDGHGHQVDTQVTREHNTRALHLRSGAHTETQHLICLTPMLPLRRPWSDETVTKTS